MATPKPTETLFVTGLPMDCTSEQANKAFSQYGTVKEATVLPVAAGKSAAACFVIMETIEQAQWIVNNLNGNIPGGFNSPITVVFATPRGDRFGGKGMKGKGMMKGMMDFMSVMMGAFGGFGKGASPYVKNYKTVMCKFHEQQGWCPRGNSCTYAHGEHELGGGGKGKGKGKGGMLALMGGGGGGGHNAAKFKTQLCNYFMQGSCQKADSCVFAHGAHELRTPGA